MTTGHVSNVLISENKQRKLLSKNAALIVMGHLHKPQQLCKSDRKLVDDIKKLNWHARQKMPHNRTQCIAITVYITKQVVRCYALTTHSPGGDTILVFTLYNAIQRKRQ